MSSGKLLGFSVSPGAVSSAGSAAQQAAAAQAAAAQQAAAQAAAAKAAAAHAAALHAAAVHVAIAAAGGVAIVGAAAAAVVLTRTAMTGLVAFSDAMEAGAAAWQQQQDQVEAWDEAIVAVQARSARIRVLASAQPGGGNLPGPISPAGWSVAQMRAWCEMTDKALADAEEQLAGRSWKAAMGSLGTLPGGQALLSHVPKPVALQRCYAPPAERLAARRNTASRAGDLTARTAATIEKLLGDLPPDVSVADLAAVQKAAARAAQAAAHGQALLTESWLSDAGERAAAAIKHADQHRRDALDAAVYLSALEQDDLDGHAPPPDDGPAQRLRQQLQAVLAGAELTAELRLNAISALKAARQRAEAVFVQTQLRDILLELDCDVQPANAADGPGEALRVAGGPLGDASVLIELSAGELAARLLAGPSGQDMTDSWRAVFNDVICQRLSGAGVTPDVTEIRDAGPEVTQIQEDDDSSDAEKDRGSAPRYRQRGTDDSAS
jgi:hypothetical protein